LGIKGDGTNEGSKLQDALDYAAANGFKKVIFPTKKIIGVTDYVETPENIELVGNGCTIRLVDNAIIDHEKGFLYIHENCHTHDLKFDGNRWNQTLVGGINGRPGATNGIILYTGSRFENNEVFNIGAYSLYTYKGDNIVINNNIIHDSWQYGIATAGEPGDFSNNITITNNIIYKCEQVGIKLRYCSNSLVSGNTVTMPIVPGGEDPRGIALYSFDGPNNNIKITNNTISGLGAGYDTGISSDDQNNTAITITGNRIDNVWVGIRIQFPNPVMSGNVITNYRYTDILYG
jgi:parallel beta-helix repeat protein